MRPHDCPSCACKVCKEYDAQTYVKTPYVYGGEREGSSGMMVYFTAPTIEEWQKLAAQVRAS